MDQMNQSLIISPVLSFFWIVASQPQMFWFSPNGDKEFLLKVFLRSAEQNKTFIEIICAN